MDSRTLREISVSSPLSAVHHAADQFSCCVHNVAAWMMSISRLHLNANKTHVLWLDSRHNVDRLATHEVQVLASTVGVVPSARDLGVVIDSRW